MPHKVHILLSYCELMYGFLQLAQMIKLYKRNLNESKTVHDLRTAKI